MRKRLAAALALALASIAAHADDEHLSFDHARLYTRESDAIWRALLQTAEELGLDADFSDEAVGVFNTGWTSVSGRRSPPGAPRPTLPDGRVAEAFQLHVLVSAYAWPGRVHVNSVLRAGKGRDESFVFDEGSLERWFLAALERHIGEKGSALPRHYRDRRSLSSSLADHSRYDPCAARVGAVKPGQSARQDIPDVTIPDLLPFTRFEPGPRSARGSKRETFEVELTVLEDGAVSEVRWTKDRPADELAQYAEGALRLWRFLPGKKRGCPIETRTLTTLELIRSRE